MRYGFAIGLFLAPLLLSSLAHADDPPPSAERIKSAATEYDAGRRAYTDNKFEEAAIHFENAYHDSPNAQTLRNAIRARRQGGQLARAATLAALAESRYTKDDATIAAIRDTLTEADTQLHKVLVACKPDCGLAADGRVVSLEDAAKATLFFEPGPHTLVASWSDDRSKEVKIDGAAGTKERLSLSAPPVPIKIEPPPNVDPNPPPVTPDTSRASTKPLGPALFFVGLGLTAVSGAVLIWSGIDAINNPGKDAVKAQCVGLGTSCPAYETGRNAQLRTNILIGTTAGLGALTGIVGIFLTQWTSSKSEPTSKPKLTPTPAVSWLPGGAAATLTGTF